MSGLRRQPGAVWDGHFFDGQSAQKRDIKVEVTAGGLVLQLADGTERIWPYHDFLQTQGFHAGQIVRFERDDEAIVIADAGILRAIQVLAGGYAQRFHDPRLRVFELPVFAAAALALVGLIAAAYVWGLPAATGFAADRIPVAWEEQLGRSVVSHMAPPESRCEDPARLGAIEELVAKLVGPRSRYRYRVSVVGEDVVNAFAAPGGYIVVFNGLLRRSGSPEELAGVLAHEIEHVEQRHATRALLRELSLKALVGLIAGDAQALGTAVSAAGTVAGLSFRRQDEEAADTAGMARLARIHADPQGMIAFFRILEKEGPDVTGPLAYLSTHPRTADRIVRLRTLAARAEYKAVPLLPGRTWDDVKRICR